MGKMPPPSLHGLGLPGKNDGLMAVMNPRTNISMTMKSEDAQGDDADGPEDDGGDAVGSSWRPPHASFFRVINLMATMRIMARTQQHQGLGEEGGAEHPRRLAHVGDHVAR